MYKIIIPLMIMCFSVSAFAAEISSVRLAGILSGVCFFYDGNQDVTKYRTELREGFKTWQWMGVTHQEPYSYTEKIKFTEKNSQDNINIGIAMILISMFWPENATNNGFIYKRKF